MPNKFLEWYLDEQGESLPEDYIVTFVNDKERVVRIQAIYRDSMARPVYIEDIDGTLYNWMTIISVKKES